MVLCLPADESGRAVLSAINDFQLHSQNTLGVFVDVFNLPSWLYYFQNSTEPWELSATNISDNIQMDIKRNALIFTSDNFVYLTLESYIVRSIRNTLEVNSNSDNAISFMLGDFRLDDSLRPLLFVRRDNFSDHFVEKVANNLEEWSLKHKQLDECDGCKSDFEKTLSVLVILGCSCLFVSVILAAAALARNQLMKKRVAKGPYKVLLTATDFVFPQIADSRRVSTIENLYIHASSDTHSSF